MSFAHPLLAAMRAACGPSVLERGLTAEEAARAVSHKLSRRTVEDWIQGRREPPDWTHEWIISRVTAAAKREGKARWNMTRRTKAVMENEELIELREWVLAAGLPTTPPKFLSTKYLIAERKRCRMALECALDYSQHMAPEDLTLIRAAYERAPIETK